MPRWTLSIIGAAVLAAGCSKPPTLTEFDDPTTVVAAPTSAPATTQPATTVAPATVPPTIPSTAPTTVSTDALTAEVAASLVKIDGLLRTCFVAPADCDVSALAVEYSPAFDHWKILLQGWVERGEASRPRDISRWVVEEVRLGTDPSQAIVRTCFVDADVLVKDGDPATASDDVVINDLILSYRDDVSMTRTDAGWRVFTATRVEDLGEGDQCG